VGEKETSCKKRRKGTSILFFITLVKAGRGGGGGGKDGNYAFRLYLRGKEGWSGKKGEGRRRFSITVAREVEKENRK